MNDQEEHDRKGTLSVKDMQDWLHDEIRDSAKAHELRVKGATEFVTAYAEGKLSPEQAMDRLMQHDRRWGSEPLYGTSAFPGMSDQDIIDKIDAARSERLDVPRKPFPDRTKDTGARGR